MRRFFIIVLPILCMALQATSQIIHYGVSPQFNLATQLLKNPDKPEDGTFQWNSLATVGVTTFIELEHTKNLNSLIRLGYSRKGFIDPVQEGGISVELVNRDIKNTFDYLNLDILGKVHLGKARVNPYLTAGLQASYLLKKTIHEFPEVNILNMYPEYSEYKKFCVGYIGGLGAEIGKWGSVDMMMSMDFLKPVSTDQLQVRNWVWTAGINLNMDQLITML